MEGLARVERRESTLVSSNQISQTKKQQRAISRAFDGACDELGFACLASTYGSENS